MGGGSQILRVLDPCTDDAGEPTEKRSERGRKLVTADKPTVLAEPLLDPVTM